MMQHSEPEFKGPIWKHPYVLYILLTLVLFIVLLVLGWIGWKSGFVAGSGN